jgi:hypothetical protein
MSAEDYRDKADEWRARAQREASGYVREAFLRLAADWDHLAREREVSDARWGGPVRARSSGNEDAALPDGRSAAAG